MAIYNETYEIRCPIYEFIHYNELEKEIINQKSFQRLRKIRQLGWTDYIYPSAMHTRFEHSLGVMHMASLMFDRILDKSKQHLIDVSINSGYSLLSTIHISSVISSFFLLLLYATLSIIPLYLPSCHIKKKCIPSLKGILFIDKFNRFSTIKLRL